MIELLKTEVVPSIGCVEPMSVAMATAKARELLGVMPERIVARLSNTIIKNSMGVGIPGAKGMVGLSAAVALGAVAGVSERGLDCLTEISDDVRTARQFISEHRYEVIQASNSFEIIYIEIVATAGDHKVKVVVAKEHTHYIYLKHDDAVLLDERHTLAREHDRNHDTMLSMALIHEFATKTPLEDLRFILKSAEMNKEVAQIAFKGDYGLNLGRMLKGSFVERMVGQNIMPRLVCYTCAAADVRMSGARVRVMSNMGSGNQGIVATLPVTIFAEETQCPESKLIRALVLSHLTCIYQRQLLGKLSAHCTCVLAGTGAAVGITYLMGGDYEQITYAVKNQIAPLAGIVCDGAKPSCVLKLSQAVSTSFQSAMMAMQNIYVQSTDGIIEDDVDRSIDNLADIGRDAMHEMDSTILKIMTEKEGEIERN